MQPLNNGDAAPAQAEGHPPPPGAVNIHWIGPPVHVEQNVAHYKCVQIGNQLFSTGDFVYLQPAEPNLPLYIARIDALLQLNTTAAAASQLPTAEAASDDERPQSSVDSAQKSMSATVTWFYRPLELDQDSALPIFPNEVFASDEQATHPLDAVAGRCTVLLSDPQTQSVPATTLQQEGTVPDVYVCYSKYISSEGRVVPLPGSETVPDEARPLLLENGRIIPRSKPRLSSHAAAAAAAAAVHSPPKKKARTPSRKPRKQAQKAPTPMETNVPLTPTPTTPTTTAATAAAAAAAVQPVSPRTHSRKRRSPAASAEGGLAPIALATSHSVSQGASQQGISAAAAPPPSSHHKQHQEEGPQPHHGRWSRDRFNNAQRSLICILKLMNATTPDTAVLRPVLREEARKVIGDTGLLDHLLKHLADQVVNEEGEKLRRRHNREGHMEYWLQNPAAAEHEEELLKEEMTALSEELREVKEIRHTLQTVRHEASAAIHAVSELKEHPEEAAEALGVRHLHVPMDVSARVAEVEKSTVDLTRRLHDAEALAASRLEELRGEMTAAGHLIGQHLSTFTTAVEELAKRCAELERKEIIQAEAAAGRYEALGTAVRHATATTDHLKQEMTQRDGVINRLQLEIFTLRQSLSTLVSSAATAAAATGAPPMGHYLQLQAPVQHSHRGDLAAVHHPNTPMSIGTTPTTTTNNANLQNGRHAAPAATTAATGVMTASPSLALPMPGQVLEPSTVQDMSVAGTESARGMNPMMHLIKKEIQR